MPNFLNCSDGLVVISVGQHRDVSGSIDGKLRF